MHTAHASSRPCTVVLNAAKMLNLVSHRTVHAATKEPKLQAARRIVPEWPEYDAKVTKFTEQARSVLALEDAEILSLSKIGLRSAVSSEREVVSEKREEL